ncbi:MAG: formimidoylglutamate deiminase [Actinomycetes bacterium]
MTRRRFHAGLAWLPPGRLGVDVQIDVTDQVLTTVTEGVPAPSDAMQLPGVVLPGFANSHSHAFHRALRGRTHLGGGSFWSWREQMYALAARLDPDSYLELATATYAEMALAGVTCVGEFHYVHHQPDGAPYDEPNAMGDALREAARRAGIRITLLDTCYLTAGIGEPLRREQRRFSDGDAPAWATRALDREADATTRLGVALHSVRAVPLAAYALIGGARERIGFDAPLHVHVSEQPAENEACLAAYGRTPVELLDDHELLGRWTTAVHATHLTRSDVGLLGDAGASACFCPTTERDLADGIGPARALADAGARLTLGSDQHAVVDLLEEARALEMHERLVTGARGRFAPAALVAALTEDGHASLGWPEAGRIEAGGIADLVAVRLDSVRTAGVDPAQVVLAATAADVDTVVVGGEVVVHGGRHALGDVGQLLDRAITNLWSRPAGSSPPVVP